MRQQLNKTSAEKDACRKAVTEIEQTASASRTWHVRVRGDQFQGQQNEQQRQRKYDQHHTQLQYLQQLHVENYPNKRPIICTSRKE